MLTIHVVQDPNGWSIRNGEGVRTPFRSKALAVVKADMLAAALRRHGAATRVVVEAAATAAGSETAAPAERAVVMAARPPEDELRSNLANR